ncbi:MAG: nickel-dependent lactate racemase family protein, partial [Candidatus Hecatellaceae archaeon]
RDLKALAEALNNPVEAQSLDDFFKPEEKILFLVNDATRPTPTARVLEALRPWLRRVDAHFLIACGAHLPPSESQLKRIFGRFYAEYRGRVGFSSPGYGCYLRLGETSRGHSVEIHEVAVKAERVFVVNSVEPHYFAGFTGGRKSIMPGVASEKSIEENHRLALEEGAKPLALKGNPVHEDMEEAAEIYSAGRQVYSLAVVLDGNRRIASAWAGNLKASFYRAAEDAGRLYAVEVEGMADVVVAVAAPPLDINLHQAQKALEHGKLALKPGGIIILVASCREGLGSFEFYRLLAKHESPEKVVEEASSHYRLGYHKAARIAELALKAEVWGVTGLEAETLRKAFIKPFRSLQEALDEALKVKGREAEVLVLPDAGLTIPLVKA